MWLSVLAIRETQGLSTRTAVVVVLPYVVIGSLLLLLAVLLVAVALLALPLLLAAVHS